MARGISKRTLATIVAKKPLIQKIIIHCSISVCPKVLCTVLKLLACNYYEIVHSAIYIFVYMQARVNTILTSFSGSLRGIFWHFLRGIRTSLFSRHSL